jgi:hypothetical protein
MVILWKSMELLIGFEDSMLFSAIAWDNLFILGS